jgi:hypothetical protein
MTKGDFFLHHHTGKKMYVRGVEFPVKQHLLYISWPCGYYFGKCKRNWTFVLQSHIRTGDEKSPVARNFNWSDMMCVNWGSRAWKLESHLREEVIENNCCFRKIHIHDLQIERGILYLSPRWHSSQTSFVLFLSCPVYIYIYLQLSSHTFLYICFIFHKLIFKTLSCNPPHQFIYFLKKVLFTSVDNRICR